jgi:hypothetical protein
MIEDEREKNSKKRISPMTRTYFRNLFFNRTKRNEMLLLAGSTEVEYEKACNQYEKTNDKWHTCIELGFWVE